MSDGFAYLFSPYLFPGSVQCTATVDWQASSRWRSGIDSSFVGRRYDFELPVAAQNTAGGYSLVNLRANYQISSYLSAFIRIDNLWNQYFHQYVGFPDPGIYVRSGLSFEGIRLRRAKQP